MICIDSSVVPAREASGRIPATCWLLSDLLDHISTFTDYLPILDGWMASVMLPNEDTNGSWTAATPSWSCPNFGVASEEMLDVGLWPVRIRIGWPNLSVQNVDFDSFNHWLEARMHRMRYGWRFVKGDTASSLLRKVFCQPSLQPHHTYVLWKHFK